MHDYTAACLLCTALLFQNHDELIDPDPVSVHHRTRQDIAEASQEPSLVCAGFATQAKRCLCALSVAQQSVPSIVLFHRRQRGMSAENARNRSLLSD